MENGIVVENEIAGDGRFSDESRENGIDESFEFGGRVNRFDGFEKRSVIDGWETENALWSAFSIVWSRRSHCYRYECVLPQERRDCRVWARGVLGRIGPPDGDRLETDELELHRLRYLGSQMQTGWS